MEQRQPSALPVLCPLCGGSDVIARSVMALGHERIVTYGCRTCAQHWQEARRESVGLFDPPPAVPALDS
jgi:hypothetical protein